MEKLAFVVLFVCILAGTGLNAWAWAQHKGIEDQFTPLHTLSTPSPHLLHFTPTFTLSFTGRQGNHLDGGGGLGLPAAAGALLLY